jgi:hypothetical protein
VSWFDSDPFLTTPELLLIIQKRRNRFILNRYLVWFLPSFFLSTLPTLSRSSYIHFPPLPHSSYTPLPILPFRPFSTGPSRNEQKRRTTVIKTRRPCKGARTGIHVDVSSIAWFQRWPSPYKPDSSGKHSHFLFLCSSSTRKHHTRPKQQK